MAKRKRLTIRQCRTLLKRQGGKCAAPGCETILVLGPKGQHTNFIDEHRVPVALCRTTRQANALKNRELRCKPCAEAKTNRPKSGGIGGDQFEIKKTGRMRTKHRMPVKRKAKGPTRSWPQGRKLQSRGFDKRKRQMRGHRDFSHS